jgi:hypothetical protein
MNNHYMVMMLELRMKTNLKISIVMRNLRISKVKKKI